jgi:hypothetical protein
MRQTRSSVAAPILRQPGPSLGDSFRSGVHRLLIRSLVLAALLTAVPAARAGLSPESVALVVNADSWASLTVANEYAALRHIPARNVILLHGLTAPDSTDINRFRTEILGPVLHELDVRGLRPQIDCITYSIDIPSAVDVSADMAGRSFGQTITPVASTNSLTYLHEWVMKKDADYLRLDINRYSRRTLPLVDGAPLSPQEREAYQAAMKMYDQKQYGAAAEAIATLVKTARNDGGVYYNLACCQALAGKADDAMKSLLEAAERGWRNSGQTESDADLVSLRDRAEFKSLIAKMKATRVQVQDTIGFSAQAAWTEKGEIADNGRDPGPHYMLSTMLGVNTGRANSVDEVRTCLKRASIADGTWPRGTIYIERNGDIRSATRAWAFADLVDQLKQAGVNCVLEDGVLPTNRADVAGAVVGIAEFDWNASKSKVIAGAICEHLTSCGGMMGERDGQTPCTEFIRAGAAGSSGAVTEPYALQEKFPSPFMHLHYVKGSTLVEAFYQSLEGPYQLLIIGDPMCAPWRAKDSLSIEGVQSRDEVKGSITLKAKAANAGGFALFVDGLRTEQAGAPAFTLDTTRFADGEHTISIVATLNDQPKTCVRRDVVVSFANHGQGVTIAKKPAPKAAWGQKIAIELSCEGATSIEVLHFDRAIAKQNGAKATIEIDTTGLGMGRVELRPVGVMSDGTRVRGAAIRCEITDPVTRRAINTPAGAQKGLKLVAGGRAPVTVLDTFGADWIAAAGVKEGEEFELSGVFEAGRADLYQLQLRTNSAATIEIDGQPALLSDGWTWRYAPVQLAQGRHELKLRGKASRDPRVDLRIGAAGTWHPSEQRFSHNVK